MKESIKLISVVWLVMLILSCDVNDDNNKLEINFTGAVGNYTGYSKICTTVPTADSTCTLSVPNGLKIILFNSTSIIVEDDKNVFGKINLTFTETTLESGVRFYHFEATKVHMIYNEKENKVLLDQHLESGQHIKTNIFEGFK